MTAPFVSSVLKKLHLFLNTLLLNGKALEEGEMGVADWP